MCMQGGHLHQSYPPYKSFLEHLLCAGLIWNYSQDGGAVGSTRGSLCSATTWPVTDSHKFQPNSPSLPASLTLESLGKRCDRLRISTQVQPPGLTVPTSEHSRSRLEGQLATGPREEAQGGLCSCKGGRKDAGLAEVWRDPGVTWPWSHLYQ